MSFKNIFSYSNKFSFTTIRALKYHPHITKLFLRKQAFEAFLFVLMADVKKAGHLVSGFRVC
jgi:hypothetical protein